MPFLYIKQVVDKYELYRHVIDAELQLSGKKSLTIPKELSESIFCVAYFVIFRA